MSQLSLVHKVSDFSGVALRQIFAKDANIISLDTTFAYNPISTLRQYVYDPLANTISVVASASDQNWYRIYFDGTYVHSGYGYLTPGNLMRALLRSGSGFVPVAGIGKWSGYYYHSIDQIVGSPPYIWVNSYFGSWCTTENSVSCFSFSGAYILLGTGPQAPGYASQAFIVCAHGGIAHIATIGTNLRAYNHTMTQIGSMIVLPFSPKMGDSDGTYLYMCPDNPGTIYAYSFDGSAYTQLGSVESSGSNMAIKCFGDKILVVTTRSYNVYTFNGSTFTLVASTPNVGNPYPRCGSAV